MTTRERIDAYVKSRGGICMVTHAEIARALGITREYVGQILGRRQVSRHLMLLEAFFMAHPEAALPKSRGGMTMREIATQLGMTIPTVEKGYKALGYPPRRLMKRDARDRAEQQHAYYAANKEHHKELVHRWKRENPERWREINRRANRAWSARKKAERQLAVA